MSKKTETNKIEPLTAEKEALVPVYLERYKQIGLSTRPTDRAAAAAAITQAYKDVGLLPADGVLEFFYAESPHAGQKIAACLTNGTDNPTEAQIQEEASRATYGSFEAYWVSFYAFIAEQLPVKKDPLLDTVKKIVEECGVYWTFNDAVVLTDKPVEIVMIEDKLSSKDGLALRYSDGTGIYAYKGVSYGSLLEIFIASEAETTEGNDNVK